MSPSLATAWALTVLILVPLGWLEYHIFGADDLTVDEEDVDTSGFTPTAGCLFVFLGVFLITVVWLVYFIIN